MKQILFTASFFFFAFSAVYSESFRVSNMHTYVFDTEVFQPVTLSLGYNDAASFAVKSDFLFLEGIELEIKQNKTGMNFPHSVAYSIYTEITPYPTKNKIDYSGQKLITALLPNRFSHIIRIPVKSNYSFKATPHGELLAYEKSLGFAPFLLRFNPVMKGLPEEFEKTVFTVTVRPLLVAEGGLQIKLRYPDAEPKPVSVQLNNDYITHFNRLQLIQPGTYLINVASDNYRNEVRSCIVERGKITQLDIHLKSIVPLLHIQVPENVKIVLDNQELELSKEAIPIQPGSHTVVFKIGSYELTRQINVEAGKTYNLTMSMDVLFHEAEE